MLKFEDGMILELTPDEEAAVKEALREYNEKRKNIPMEPLEVYETIAKALINQADIPDATALRMKSYYPTFDEIVGKGTEVDVGFRFTYDEKLWSVRQKHTPQSIYPPSVDTASLYEVVDDSHAGTKEDPIPYDTTMVVYKDKYYTYKYKLYLCIRDSEQPLYAEPQNLLGNYFDEINAESGETIEPVEADGTKDHPYPYDMNEGVTNGTYYIYNDVVYLCIRDSGQPLYAEPSALLNNYFQLAE